MIPKKILLNFLENNFQIKPTNSENEIRINSFFTDDKEFKLYISLEKQVFICFKSDVRGSVKYLISQFLNIPVGLVEERILTDYNFNEDDYNFKENLDIKEYKLESYLKNLVLFKDKKIGYFGKLCLKYLLDRKVPLNYIKKCGYFFDDFDKLNKRIFLPFFEENKLVYFLARSLNSKLRYLNIEGFKARNYLFNYDEIENKCCLTEGIFDALSINNIKGTCITGAEISVNQITKLLERNVKEIIYVPDNDKTGKENIIKNLDKIIFNYPSTFVPQIWIYENKDYKNFKDFNEFYCKTGCNEIEEKYLTQYNKLNYYLNSLNSDNWEFKEIPF